MLGISIQDLLALGRLNPADSSEPFNMAYLAIRGSGAVNGVSRLHGQVSRRIFQPLFPNWPENEVPVGHVTNGVHMASWDSEEADSLWTGSCGKDRWLGTLEHLEEDMRLLPDFRLWECRASARQTLVEYVRERLSKQLEAAGASPEEVEKAKHLYDPNVLTMGFARRFTSYKRPNLLLHDRERLLRILTDARRPVQLIIAGKAHPDDQPGQALIREWTDFIKRSGAQNQVIFLSDYDMLLTGQLVQGVDVWINTPRRPWEACGTSGMKVLVNGGLNLSELDGWWAEAYCPEVGWALGDGGEHDDDPDWDAKEADDLYRLLEQEVIPQFYARDDNGIPTAWVSRIRESMARLTPRFSANRTVREYTEKHYLPAAAAYLERAADKGAVGRQVADWQKAVTQKWLALRFGELKVETIDGQHIFEVQIYLDDLDTKAVRVELYAEPAGNEDVVRQEMKSLRPMTGAAGGYVYGASVSAARPAADYTPRVIPAFPGVAVPLEAPKILWQR
jgi:starch phosphorylase